MTEFMKVVNLEKKAITDETPIEALVAAASRLHSTETFFNWDKAELDQDIFDKDSFTGACTLGAMALLLGIVEGSPRYGFKAGSRVYGSVPAMDKVSRRSHVARSNPELQAAFTEAFLNEGYKTVGDLRAGLGRYDK